jgi:hypothetical protein
VKGAALALLSCALLSTAAPAREAEKKSARTVVSEGTVLDLKSPFFRELLARPLPSDRRELDTVAFVFRQAGHETAYFRLLDWQERRELKALLGERFDPPATVQDAITGRGEPGLELRRRAMRAILSLEPAQSDGSEVTYADGPIRYLGNSVWRGGRSNRILWMRVRAQNNYKAAIEEFEARMRHSNEIEFVFRCKAEKGPALAPKRTALTVCRADFDAPKPEPAIDQLLATPLAIGLSSVRLPDVAFGETSQAHPVDPNHLPLVQKQAREMLQGNPCEALLACAQAAKHAAAQAVPHVDWRAEQEQRREKSAQRKKDGQELASAGLIVALLVTLALAVAGRSWQPVERGFLPSILAAWTVLAGVVVGMATIAFLVEADSLGYLGFFVFAIWMYGGPVLLLGLLLLGGTMFMARFRTVLRMASLGFGLSAAGLTIAAAIRFFSW